MTLLAQAHISPAFELLARSHHRYSHHTGNSGTSFAGAYWMIPLGIVIAIAWVAFKRLRSR
ncbi:MULTISPECIES: hypothetical protein [unclassified Streptomyces]|uniref:hypothetical protein n=1 Tax=unclassified Streptomyces TaxID=2593676 RepID=UPI00381A9445